MCHPLLCLSSVAGLDPSGLSYDVPAEAISLLYFPKMVLIVGVKRKRCVGGQDGKLSRLESSFRVEENCEFEFHVRVLDPLCRFFQVEQ